MQFKELTLPGAQGESIRMDVRYCDPSNRKNCTIIYCHGFKGFRRWGFHPYLCEALANSGFPTIVLDFSHNGVGSDNESFTELEKFKENRIAFEQFDLEAVIEEVEREGGKFKDATDRGPIVLIGHSRGAAAVYPVASRRDSVAAVVSLAGISHLSRIDSETAKEWERSGVHYVLNSRTRQQLPCGTALLHECLNEQDMIERSVRSLKIPYLVAHGDQDPTVPVEEATTLASWNSDRSQLFIVPGADHAFNCTHPFTGPSSALNMVEQRIITFLDDIF